MSLDNSNFSWVALPHRTCLKISGADAEAFLQGIISNDITKADNGNAIYATLLTPQGKFLFDFFIVRLGDDYIFDCEVEKIDGLVEKLNLYRLNAEVIFEKMPDMNIYFIWGKDCQNLENYFLDPRKDGFGFRLFSTKQPKSLAASIDDYNYYRIKTGIPEAGIELTQQRYPLECNLDLLNAIDFHKGCFIGQETTSRMKRRADGGRKRLILIESENESILPLKGTIKINGNKIGELLSSNKNIGLALLRIDKVPKNPASALLGDTKLNLAFSNLVV